MKKIFIIKVSIRTLAIIAVLIASVGLFSCGKHNFLGGGKALFVESLPYVIIPDDPANPAVPPNDTKFHDLFTLAPGQVVPKANYTGGIDPVGTTITEDFDGDGIPNANETINNIWVADYPLVEATIAPPVTMQIEVLLDQTGKEETFSSEISTDDTEDNIEKGTESVHRNEINTRTVQYQDTMNQSGSTNMSMSMNVAASANVSAMGVSAGASVSYGSSVSNSFSAAYGETKNKWKDVPFKDNLGKDSKSLKRTEAAKKSRNLRSEIRKSFTTTTRVKPDAGYIRAALYIKNYSVNMPVRMTNILCSFMLESTTGELLPVQSFRLREEDYSIFKVDLYGGEMFGPYVIKLEGLNTFEIKDAIAKGYNPKIFIVDYEMTHVDDSNYKTALSSRFSGNNLKIVEENVKGRTAGIKLVGPGFRHFFRVAAFNVLDAAGKPMNESATEPQPGAVVSMSPGVPLEKALKRISYSGFEMEFADFVLDFSGVGDGNTVLKIPKDPNNPNDNYYETPCFHIRSIMNLNGKKTTLPILQVVNNTDGTKTYIMKPINKWSDAELIRCGMWVVFDQGRYYRHAGDFGKNPILNMLDNQNGTYSFNKEIVVNGVVTGTIPVTVPKVQGINGCIWPGDHYDIVFISMAEILGIPDEVMNKLVGMDDNHITLIDILTQTSSMGTEKKQFGYNPIESVDTALDFNTRWSSQDTGERPFIPNVHSQYLGTAIEGDTVELELKLNKTKYLNPSFGAPVRDANNSVNTYTNFSYSMLMDTAIYPFEYQEALDFELSFAINGKQGDWMNLIPARSPYSESYWEGMAGEGAIEYEWDYLEQNFLIRFTVPNDLPGVGQNQVVDLYLRTAPNSAFRESIWPLHYSQVKKFRGRVVSAVIDKTTSQTTIITEYSSGQIVAGDDLHINSGANLYDVISAEYKEDLKRYNIVVTGEANAQKGDWALLDLAAPLTEPKVQLSVDDGFFTQWNGELVSHPDHTPLLTGNANTGFTPVQSLGYQPDYMVGNWLGNNNFGNPFWNNWADAGQWDTFVNRIFRPLISADNGYYLSLIPSRDPMGNDFLVNTAVGNTSNSFYPAPQLSMSGDRALVVYNTIVSGYQRICGRIINITTGEIIGNEIPISTTNTNHNFPGQVGISGDRALVVWQYGYYAYDIRARIINMTTGQGVGDDFLISNPGSLNSPPQLTISGDIALVVWSSLSGTNDIRGRFISMSAAAPVGTLDFLVSTTNASEQTTPQLSTSNDRALVVWQSGDNGSNFDIRGRIATMSTVSFAGNDFLVSTTNANNQMSAQLSTSGDRALVIWQSQDNGSNNDIRGRVMTLSTGAFTGNDFLISTSNTNEQSNAQVAVSNDRALVLWQSLDGGTYYVIRGRTVNMTTGAGIGNDFLVSTKNVSNQYLPKVSVSGDNALAVWVATDSGCSIRGQNIYFKTGVSVGDDFLLNSTNNVFCYVANQIGPQINNSGNRAMAVWLTNTSGNNFEVRGAIGDLCFTGNSLPHGLSNFFVSPMIERDYTVRVRMIDPLSQ